jgi:hypothetical protein
VTAETLSSGQARKVHNNEDVAKLWSEPVNGLRARLVATQEVFALDHPISLIMLFHNVGDKGVELPGGVNVMPTLAMKGEHPYGEDHDFNAAIWMTHQARRLEPQLGLEARLRKENAAVQIDPGEIYMTIINIEPVKVHRQEPHRHQPIQMGSDVQRDRARLAVTEPGEYVLEALWKPAGLATASRRRRPEISEQWRGEQIEFPPITVRIVNDVRNEGVVDE